MKQVRTRDIEGNEFTVDVDQVNWRPSVYGVVIQDGKMLLAPDYMGWDFPGGGMDMHETIEETLVREVWEETGYKVRPVQLLHVDDAFYKRVMTGDHIHSILVYFLCEVVSGEISTANLTEYEQKFGGQAEWVPIEKLSELTFSNSIDSHALIKQALAT